MKTQKVIFVTGASKGFGLEIAKEALAAGDKVVATVRTKPEQLAATLSNHQDLLIVTMDVSNEKQVQDAVTSAIDRFGKIDVLVNNAGYGMVSAIEEASDAEIKNQYATNVFGALNVIRAVLPHMRKEKSGYIINVTSMFGYDVIPGWAIYGSTKFALEGLSKGLAMELAPFGIKVTALAPGLFSTDFLSTESYSASANVIADYAESVGKMRVFADELHGNQAGDPNKLAKVVVTLAHEQETPLHLPMGKDAVKMYQDNIANTGSDIEKWLDISTSTDRS